MPNVSVTIRELKNKASGLDLSIPSHTEKSGLLQKTVTCKVVAVSNLAVFKLPQHKDTDVIQFSVSRELDEFENLLRNLTSRFPGTVFPPLPKSLFTIVEGTTKQQVSQLEHFLKFIASTPKLAKCPDTVHFLGFTILSGGRKGRSSSSEIPDSSITNLPADTQQIEAPSAGLFETDENDDDEDLFSSPSGSTQTKQINPATRLFDDLDYGGEVSVNDELVMVPGAVASHKPHQRSLFADEEDEEDLLRVSDDLQDILKVTSPSNTSSEAKPSICKPDIKSPKPKILPKPSSSKPRVSPKPSKITSKSQPKDSSSKRLTPNIPPKPPSKSLTEDNDSGFGTDDILKYIQDNTNKDADVDLFS